MIKPEDDDPLSMLLTLQQFDDRRLADDEKEEQEKWDAEDKERKKGTDEEEARLKDGRYLALIRRELDGVKLRTANWKVVPTGKKDVVQFRYALAEKGLEITKTYRLAKVPDGIASRTAISRRITWSSRSRFATSAASRTKWPIGSTGPTACPPKARGMPAR